MMVRAVAALVSGLLFGFGLALSEMVNPARVLGFLDVAGRWDPSLALVLVARGRRAPRIDPAVGLAK